MLKIKSLPLVAAMTLLFAFAIAACTSEKTVDVPPYPDLASLDSEAAMLYPDNSAFEIGEPTLKQVLDRARLAMGDIVTYKTRGETKTWASIEGFSDRTLHFTEFHSYDHYRFGDGSPEDESGYMSEWLVVGSRVFSRNSRGGGWQEGEPFSGPRTPTPPSAGHFSLLYDDELVLASTNEVTDAGVLVYRLQVGKNFELSSASPNYREYELESRTKSLLIDKKTYRIVERIIEHRKKNNSFDESSDEPGTDIEWWQTVYTERYYEYNEPVVIEVPAEYVPWSDAAVLSSVLGD